MVKVLVKLVSENGVFQASPASIEIPHRIYAQGLRQGDWDAALFARLAEYSYLHRVESKIPGLFLLCRAHQKQRQ